MSKDEIKTRDHKSFGSDIEAHTQKVEAKEYETDAELNRDIAIASELCQKYVDLLWRGARILFTKTELKNE